LKPQFGWELTEDDLDFFAEAIRSTHREVGRLVVFGVYDTRLLAATASIKTAAQNLDILVDTLSAQDPTSNALFLQALKHTDNLKIAIADDLANKLSRQAKSPALLIVNHPLPPLQLRYLLELSHVSGCSQILGWGYNAEQHETMRYVHEYRSVTASDNVWLINPKAGRALSAKPGATPAGSQTLGAARLRVVRPESTSLVSIIIPAYEARPYLHEALGDVASQSYNQWELVVVEDASQDSVEDVVSEFSSQFPYNRVVYHRKPSNTGASDTRNVAIGLAEGDAIAFLDSDDRWLPDHLERKLRLLEIEKTDVAYSSVDMFDHENSRSLFCWGPSEQELSQFPTSLFLRNFIQPSGVVIKREAIDQVGEFDQAIFLVEDYDYWLRLISAGKKFSYDPKVTTRYRKNHASASTTGRMVLAYDGIARVAVRYGELIQDESLRRLMLTRHLVTAGTGHFSYASTARNRIDPYAGYELLKRACEIDEELWEAKRWTRLAGIALRTGTSPLLRRAFRLHYKKCCHVKFSLGELPVAA
jgi:glycosyltransferase involved in cell wall biosynthesis